MTSLPKSERSELPELLPSSSRQTSFCQLCCIQPVSVTLPCTDSLCYRCVQSILPARINKTSGVRCPCCECDFELDDILEGPFLSALARVSSSDDLYRQAHAFFAKLDPDDAVELCSSCQALATAFCTECKASYCTDCAARTHAEMLDHHWRQLGNARAAPVAVPSAVCSLHSLPANVMCEQCGLVLCARCAEKHSISTTRHDVDEAELGTHNCSELGNLREYHVVLVLERALLAYARFTVFVSLHAEMQTALTRYGQRVDKDPASPAQLEYRSLLARVHKVAQTAQRAEKVRRMLRAALVQAVGDGVAGVARAVPVLSTAVVTAEAAESQIVRSVNAAQLILADIQQAPLVIFQSAARVGGVYPGAPLTVRNASVGAVVEVESLLGERVPYVICDLRVLARSVKSGDPTELCARGRPFVGRPEALERLERAGRVIEDDDLIDWEAPTQRFTIRANAGCECAPEAFYAPELVYAAVRPRRATAWGEVSDDDEYGLDYTTESTEDESDEDDTLPVLEVPRLLAPPTVQPPSRSPAARRFVTIEDTASGSANYRLVRPASGAAVGAVLPGAEAGYANVVWLGPGHAEVRKHATGAGGVHELIYADGAMPRASQAVLAQLLASLVGNNTDLGEYTLNFQGCMAKK